MNCPRCSSTQLSETTYESVNVDKCSRCGGVWLDHCEILEIIETRDKKVLIR
jgi:Zn-finger nucleic acid-binding protein